MGSTCSGAPARPVVVALVVALVTALVAAPSVAAAATDFTSSTLDITSGASASRRVVPGETLTYTIVVANTGDTDATGVTVRTVLPSELGSVVALDGGSYNPVSDTITWTPGIVSAGASALTLRFTASGVIPLANGTPIDVQALVTSFQGDAELTDDPSEAGADSVTRAVVLSSPSFVTSTQTVTNLSLPGSPLFRAGDTIETAIAVRNTGTATATNVTAAHTIDVIRSENLFLVTAGSSNGVTATFTSGSVPALSSITPGDEVVVVVRARIKSGLAAGTSLTTQAQIGADELAGVQLTDADLATTDVSEPTVVTVSFPDLAVTKTVEDLNGGDVEPEDVLRYSITLINNGNAAAEGVVVTDVLDPRLEVVAAEGAVNSAGTLTWTLGDLAAGASERLVVDVRIPAGTAHGAQIANQADVSLDYMPNVLSDWPDTTTQLDDATPVTVVALPSFADAFGTTSPRGWVRPGDGLTYVLHVENNGKGAATNVVVENVLGAGLELVAARDGAVVVSGGGAGEGATLRWTLGAMGVGTTTELGFDVRVLDSASNRSFVSQSATVSASELGVAAQAVAVPSSLVVVEPDFSSSSLSVVDVGGGTVQPGDRLRYTCVVRNQGAVAAVGAVLQMPLPEFTNYVAESTTLNGVAVSDSSGSAPWLEGLALESARLTSGGGGGGGGGGDGGSGSLLLDDLTVASDTWATVTFDVRVDPRALVGTLISAQAVVDASNGRPQGTDFSGTATVQGDPTIAVVGGGVAFSVGQTTTLSLDVDGDGLADVGDRIRYTSTVANVGTAAELGVTFDDVLPSSLGYVAGSLLVDGGSVTDGTDGDAGEYSLDLARVRVALGDMAVGASRTVAFDAAVVAGPFVENQASLRGRSGVTWLSDGNPSVAGEQATVTVVGGATDVMAVHLEIDDPSGGVVAPGDAVRFSLLVSNPTEVSITDVTLTLDATGVALPGTVVDAGGAVATEAGPGSGAVLQAWRIATLIPGDHARLVVDAQVNADLPSGASVTAVAGAQVTGASYASQVHSLVVGAGVGTGAVSGRLFQDLGERDGMYTAGVDVPLVGYRVQLVEASQLEKLSRQQSADDVALATVVSGTDGTYMAADVPPGTYRVRVTSPMGVLYSESDSFSMSKGVNTPLSFSIDPSGVIYELVAGQTAPVAGARVTLLDTSGATAVPVAASDLSAGQQDQVTGADGLYRFDLAAGAFAGGAREFRILVTPPVSTQVFPSVLRPPVGWTGTVGGASATGGIADAVPAGEAAFGSVGVFSGGQVAASAGGVAGAVVASSTPQAGGDADVQPYFLRLSLDASSPQVTNNHIPVDRLQERLSLDKRADRRTAVVGEVVTYTVQMTNPAADGLTTAEDGAGVVLVDRMPQHMSWVEGSSRLETTLTGGAVSTQSVAGTVMNGAGAVGGGQEVHFGPFDLPAGSVVTLRYYSVVNVGAGRGALTNRAHLLFGGQEVSPVASASVRVVDDPIFDRGTVLGRVSCVASGDDEMMRGVPGVRLYLDNGHYVDTDVDGKYHFASVEAGRHAVKIDLNTAPPGTGLIDQPLADFRLTPGLLSKIDFRLLCSVVGTPPEWVQVETNGAAGGRGSGVPQGAGKGAQTDAGAGIAGRAGDAEQTPVTLSLDPNRLHVRVDGMRQALPQLDAVPFVAGEAHGEDEADFTVRSLEVAGWDTLRWAFATPDPRAVSGWELAVFDVLTGLEVWRVSGAGAPTERRGLAWSELFEGAPLVAGRQLAYRVSALSQAGHVVDGPWRMLRLRPDAAGAGQHELGVWRGDLFVAGTAQPLPALRRRIEGLAHGPLSRLEDSNVHVGVHVAGGAGDPAGRMQLSWARATVLARLLAQAGVPAARVRVRGWGATKPIMSNNTLRGQQTNERVVLLAMTQRVRAGWMPPPDYGAWLAARRTMHPLGDVGVFEHTWLLADGEAMFVDYRQAGGARLRLRLREGLGRLGSLPEAAPPAPSGDGAQAGGPSGLRIGVPDGGWVPLGAPFASLAWESPWGSRSGSVATAADQGGTVSGESGAVSEIEPAAADFTGPPLPPALVASIQAQNAVLEQKARWQDWLTETGGVAVETRSRDGPPPDNAEVESARVWLPLHGATLAGERLTVYGQVPAGSLVWLNQHEVRVLSDGRFAHTLTLQPGSQHLTVRIQDADGRRGLLERSVVVPKWEWFLLGLGDAVAGYGSKLEGMNNTTSLDVADGVYLHGRAKAYFKGRIQGAALLAQLPFERVEATAFVDSGLRRERALWRQLIDPNRAYAVYGDASQQVQDAATRERLYVLVRADQSRLVVGNFRTQLHKVELFQYERSLFGASLDLDHAFWPKHRTQLHAVAATGAAGLVHRKVVLQGTGGSLYFLRDRAVVEGSEQVAVVVRDAISGEELGRWPQVRDRDYRMSYNDGRLTLMKPLPSVVSAAAGINFNPGRMLEGQPAFLEVSYDYEARDSLAAQNAFAVQGRYTYDDWLTVGAGFVDDAPSTAQVGHFRLAGADAVLRWPPKRGSASRTTSGVRPRAPAGPGPRLGLGPGLGMDSTADPDRADLGGEQEPRWDAELTAGFSFSQSRDADHLASVDGGITYHALGAAGALAGTQGGAATMGPAADTDGFAYRFSLRGQTPVSPYQFYFQHQDAGFYSGATSVASQGQRRVGGLVTPRLTAHDTLSLRYDGSWTQVLDAQAMQQQVVQHLTSLGYEHNRRNWALGGAIGHRHAAGLGEDEQSGTVAVFGRMRLLEGLVGTAEQEALVFGPGLYYERRGLSRYATKLGLRYAVSDALELSVEESVRWSGSNATQIGLRTPVADGLTLYTAEQLHSGPGQDLRSTTVVGAENTSVPGTRTYGEYQLDTMASDAVGRAVFGMDNRWQVADGWAVSLSYERSQRLGKRRSTALASPASAAVPGEQPFAASAQSAGGMFPSDVSSRDALSVGLDYLQEDGLKAALRSELRYDRADDVRAMADRLVTFVHAGGDWRFERDLVALASAQYATVQNTQLGREERAVLDVSLGLALRPALSNAYTVLFKWTRRYERRVRALDAPFGAASGDALLGGLQGAEAAALATAGGDAATGGFGFTRQTADVVSLEGAVELGWGFQLVGKGAVKVFVVQDPFLDEVVSTTALGLMRLNYHLTAMFDAAAEYRWLGNMLTDDSEHGALLEFAWLPVSHLAVGVGYNFTSFSDDLLAEPGVDPHGFFFRITGRY